MDFFRNIKEKQCKKHNEDEKKEEEILDNGRIVNEILDTIPNNGSDGIEKYLKFDEDMAYPYNRSKKGKEFEMEYLEKLRIFSAHMEGINKSCTSGVGFSIISGYTGNSLGKHMDNLDSYTKLALNTFERAVQTKGYKTNICLNMNEYNGKKNYYLFINIKK